MRQTRCALVTGVQTGALPICPVARGRRPRPAGLIPCGIDEYRADRAARDHFAQLLAPGGMERTAVVVEALRCAIEKNRDLALEVQALEVVHAQRRCMHGLADEYRRRLDLRLRGIETRRSEEHTSELQSLMRISYAVFCLQ